MMTTRHQSSQTFPEFARNRYRLHYFTAHAHHHARRKSLEGVIERSRSIQFETMAFLWRLVKWFVPILVALYGVYYWRVFASRRYFEGDIELKGKTAIVTGTFNEPVSIRTMLATRTAIVVHVG